VPRTFTKTLAVGRFLSFTRSRFSGMTIITRAVSTLSTWLIVRAVQGELARTISQVESDKEPGTVVSVLQKGYLLHDRVLRPALVVVSKAKEEAA